MCKINGEDSHTSHPKFLRRTHETTGLVPHILTDSVRTCKKVIQNYTIQKFMG